MKKFLTFLLLVAALTTATAQVKLDMATIEDIVNDLSRITGVSFEENKSTDERIRAAEKLKETQPKTNSMAKEIDRSER